MRNVSIYIMVLAGSLTACPSAPPFKTSPDVDRDATADVAVSIDLRTTDVRDVRTEEIADIREVGDASKDIPFFDFGDNPTLTVAGWNLESGDSDIDLLTTYVTASPEVDIWGFSEVYNANAGLLREAAMTRGRSFRYILGTTGRTDRLLILHDNVRFELLELEELEAINVTGTARAPLVATFSDRANGHVFKFMVNHLFRSDNFARHEQARLLNAWVATQSVPVIAVGDYNFDWAVIDGDSDHDRGYDLMTADDRWTWVRPAELVRTQCGSFSNYVLDFVFVNDPVANGWNPISTIAQNSPAFCDFGGIGNSSTDDAEMSDHKPVWATLYPPPLE